jgi:phosphoribosylformylglycinamidine synthase
MGSSPLPVHCLVVTRRGEDARGRALVGNAHALGFPGLLGVTVADLTLVEGTLTPAERDLLARRLLADPVADTWHWREAAAPGAEAGTVVESVLRPGVTDVAAQQVVRGASLVGVPSVSRVATGRRFVLHGDLTRDDVERLARLLLVNPVLERWHVGTLAHAFPAADPSPPPALTIALRDLDDTSLARLSQARRCALDLAEMRAIRDHFRRRDRDPTDVELESLAQTWSDHCAHKTMDARVTLSGLPGSGTVDGVFPTFIQAATRALAAPHVRSVFVDNAGVVALDDEHDVAFKVETHNHPSALEPFAGAHTGVGGVIRDILGVSARPVALTDVLCFGDPRLAASSVPSGALHPRRVREGVVAGVGDYGNKMGIPTVNGAVVYDPSFTTNPLVFCGCVGILPRGSHPRCPRVGDRVVVLGGKTGRDGTRGATFSSRVLDESSAQEDGVAVQVGSPLAEKGLVDVVTAARDGGLYHAINDCGAGGLSSAVGEMAREVGVRVNLDHVPLKHLGLAPWETWLSEAQERMVLAVPDATPLHDLCRTHGITCSEIGHFDGSGRVVVESQGRVVMDLPCSFLHGGRPRQERAATCRDAPPVRSTGYPRAMAPLGDLALKLLAHPSVASKEPILRRYDHEVGGATAVKPLCGPSGRGPSDGCVLKVPGTRGGGAVVLACGIQPRLGRVDPHRMALSVVDEAVRNAVCVGADPARLSLLDNFCLGDPADPVVMGDLVLAARGAHDAAILHRAPFISGKDSFHNTYLDPGGNRHAIPPTLLCSSLGVLPDVTRAVTMDLKTPGDALFLLGRTEDELGGSLLHEELGWSTGVVPGIHDETPALNAALHGAMMKGLVRSCHDLSEGGLAVAAAEMCVAGELGMVLTLPAGEDAVTLFSESNGRYLVEVARADAARFREAFCHVSGPPPREVGEVTREPALLVASSQGVSFSLPLASLLRAWLTEV